MIDVVDITVYVYAKRFPVGLRVHRSLDHKEHYAVMHAKK